MITILYVDDEPTLLDIAKRFLESNGDFVVNVALSAQDGLAMLSDIQFDVIVSDYQMPNTDGLTFLKLLRASGNTTPFIIFTGRGREDIASDALNSGADFYLQKGGDPESQFLELTYKIQQAVRRNRAENALKISEARFRDLFERADDLIMILSPAGMFQYVNEGWNRILEYSKEESKKISFSDIFPHDKKEEGNLFLGDLLKGKSPLKIDTCFVSRSGRRIPVEGSCSIQTDENNIVSISGIFRDISEQEKIRSELIESQRMLTMLMDNLPGMIYRCRNDRNWTMEFVSGGCVALTGYMAEDLIGNRRIAFNDLILPENRAEVWEKWQDILKIHGVFQGEYAIKTATGQIKRVWEQGRGVFSPSGELLALEGYIFDITERKLAEETLQRMNNKLKILSSTTRHDINNKLTILSGYSDLLKDMVPDEKVQSFIGIEENAIADISKILKFTKDYEQIGVEMPQWVNVHSVWSSAFSQIPIKHLTLSDTTNGLQIYADPMLERVFYHLLENTVRHAPSATTIRTGYTITDGDCTIWTEDNGPGIAREDKEKIFQRGFGKNTGLGLFISREILTITDLEIHETGEYGKGARFEIRVPKGKFRVAA